MTSSNATPHAPNMFSRAALLRLAMNVAVYFVFGGGLFAFAGLQTGRVASLAEVAAAAAGVAAWCGVLTTAVEHVAAKLPTVRARLSVGALLGALSLGGFAVALSFVAWRAPQLQFILVGVLAGALMQAARAFALGARHDEALREDEQEDEPADAAVPVAAEGATTAKDPVA